MRNSDFNARNRQCHSESERLKRASAESVIFTAVVRSPSLAFRHAESYRDLAFVELDWHPACEITPPSSSENVRDENIRDNECHCFWFGRRNRSRLPRSRVRAAPW